jgi:RNA-splicing ligase RtcB
MNNIEYSKATIAFISTDHRILNYYLMTTSKGVIVVNNKEYSAVFESKAEAIDFYKANKTAIHEELKGIVKHIFREKNMIYDVPFKIVVIETKSESIDDININK